MRRRRFHRSSVDTSVLLSVRKKLIEAFKSLRKKGLIARANYLCCQSCAGYAIAEKIENLSDEQRAKVKGVVYWHKQDNDGFNQDGHMYLAYDDASTQKYPEVTFSIAEVGKLICDTLKEYDVPHEWNGDTNTRILIKAQ